MDMDEFQGFFKKYSPLVISFIGIMFLLAIGDYRMNNVTLPPERGFPFQLVAESKWGYKWIKWITAIELSDNEDYRGYWESRGYPNDADL